MFLAQAEFWMEAARQTPALVCLCVIVLRNERTAATFHREAMAVVKANTAMLAYIKVYLRQLTGNTPNPDKEEPL